MLDSLYQSLIIFFIAEAVYWDSTIDIWEFGTTITTSCLIAMLLHGAIEIKSWVRFLDNKWIYIFLNNFLFFLGIDNSTCFVNNL